MAENFDETWDTAPQGHKYYYGDGTHPFWDTEQSDLLTNLTASASVDDTTGTPAVSVTKTINNKTANLDFAFTGIKGEQGEKGETGATGAQGEAGKSAIVTATGVHTSGAVAGTVQDPETLVTAIIYNGAQGAQGEKGDKGDTGATGETGATGPQGPQGETGAAGKDGVSPTVISTGSTASGESAGTITGADGTIITVYNGEKGETGAQGPQGETGPAGSTEGLVSDVSVTNTDGVYTVSQTKDGTTADIGSIEVPSTDNLLAEVTDSVVENTTSGYDYHTVKETENNGTQNDVGNFYIARKQITALNSDGSFTTVDQSGTEGTGSISIPEVPSTVTSALKVVKLNQFSFSDEISISAGKVYKLFVNAASLQINGGTTNYSVGAIAIGLIFVPSSTARYFVSTPAPLQITYNSATRQIVFCPSSTSTLLSGGTKLYCGGDFLVPLGSNINSITMTGTPSLTEIFSLS